MSDEPLNIGERKDVRKLQKLSAQAAARRRDTVRAFMADQANREWIWALLSEAHMFHPAFYGEAPITMAFAEGERNMGLKILNDIFAHCPERFVQMIQEANTSQQEKTDARSDRADDAADPSDPADGSDPQS